MTPQVLSIIQLQLQAERRARAIGAYSMILAVGVAVGQLLGGLLTSLQSVVCRVAAGTADQCARRCAVAARHEAVASAHRRRRRTASGSGRRRAARRRPAGVGAAADLRPPGALASMGVAVARGVCGGCSGVCQARAQAHRTTRAPAAGPAHPGSSRRRRGGPRRAADHGLLFGVLDHAHALPAGRCDWVHAAAGRRDLRDLCERVCDGESDVDTDAGLATHEAPRRGSAADGSGTISASAWRQPTISGR